MTIIRVVTYSLLLLTSFYGISQSNDSTSQELKRNLLRELSITMKVLHEASTRDVQDFLKILLFQEKKINELLTNPDLTDKERSELLKLRNDTIELYELILSIDNPPSYWPTYRQLIDSLEVSRSEGDFEIFTDSNYNYLHYLPPGNFELSILFENENTIYGLEEMEWPLPKPSSSCILYVTTNHKDSIKVLKERLGYALRDSGYLNLAAYRTQGTGYAFLTQLERLKEDGTINSDSLRWFPSEPSTRWQGIEWYLNSLIHGGVSRYRMFIFSLSSNEGAFTSSQNLSFDESLENSRKSMIVTESLTSKFSNQDPLHYARSDTSESYYLSVGVYEFLKTKYKKQFVKNPTMNCLEHLRKCGLLAEFFYSH